MRPAVDYRLRDHRIGDVGWIIHRHGILYGQEFDWDITFEVQVAQDMAGMIRHFDPAREKSLIAEAAGDILGSAFVVNESASAARLRFVYLEPSARGLGIGRRLVAKTAHFARSAGYRMMTLETYAILLAARHLYQEAGFRCVSAEPCHAFGKDLVRENWDLVL